MVEVEDIEKSPLISKAGNSLRLTKSEENLSTNLDSDSDSCCWAAEDEDISLQVCFCLMIILIEFFKNVVEIEGGGEKRWKRWFFIYYFYYFIKFWISNKKQVIDFVLKRNFLFGKLGEKENFSST